MVDRQLLEAYDEIKTKQELYIKATRYGNSIRGLGALIFLLSIIPVIPIFLEEYYGINFLYSLLGGIIIGVLLMIIGQRINQKNLAPPISVVEEMFLKAVDALKNIESYKQRKIPFLRLEAAKNLSKIERRLVLPSYNQYPFWQGLAKEINENLRLLKQNFKEKIIPRIVHDSEEDIKNIYSILEEFAKYLLNPKLEKLKALNKSMSELSPIQEEKTRLSLFERHPYMRHCFILITNALCGFIAYYLGINFLHTSLDTAYIAGISVFGTLTVAYTTVITAKRKEWKSIS